MKEDTPITWQVLLNPVAGGGRAGKVWPYWEALLRKENIPFSIHRTVQARSAVQLVMDKTGPGYRHWILAGGDGLLNEVANGLLLKKDVETKLALLPIGSGNDWRRTHQSPRSPKKWIAMLRRRQAQFFPAGRADYHTPDGPQSRYFINAAGAAYDGHVVRYANAHVNRLPGTLQYAWAVTRCLRQYQPQELQISIDGEVIQDRFHTVSIALGKYSGGGMSLTPHYQTEQKDFAVMLALAISNWKILLESWRFYTGKIGGLSTITLTHGLKIKIESLSDLPVLLELDGDYVGYGPVTLEYIPAGIQVLI